jgi:beta-lactamase regulating signal transducer with metallopeptidase domain
MKAEIQEVCTQLLAATANGVYQGIMVALLVGLFLRLLVRTNAATRHAIWFATLAILVLAIPAHYWLAHYARQPLSLVELSAPGIAPTAGGERYLAKSIQPILDFLPLGLVDGVDGSASAGSVGGAGLSPDLIPQNQPSLPLGSEPFLPVLPGSIAQAEAPSSAAAHPGGYWQTIFDKLLHPISWNLESAPGLPALLLALIPWGSIALIRLLRLCLRLLQLRTLAEGSSPAHPELASLFARLLKEGKERRGAELRVFERHRCPAVLGFGRPIILLPQDLASQTELVEAEHVLRHELAHLRRYDDWANLAQHLVEAVLFFHPAIWWIGKELSLQREIACDDYVLQHAGGRRSYALTLTSVASRIQQPTPLLAPGVSNSKSQLQQRINMILNTRRNSSPGLAKARLVSVLSATSLLAVLALCAGPRFGLAQTAASSDGAIVAAGPTAAPSAARAPEVAPAPSVASIVVGQEEEPAPPTPAVDRGPKFKPESPDQEPPEPGDVAVPEPPDVPRVARLGKPGRAPRSPDAVDENTEGNPSIEGRLRRLEKMVKELMSQQNPKRPHAYMYLKDGGEQNLNIDQQALDRMKQSAERQAQRAAEQAQRAAEQAKRANKDLEARLEQNQDGKGQFREAAQQQLEALRKAREGLGQEMERLDRQIQKLEKQQQRGDKDQQQRRSEMPNPKLQAQADPTPEAAR